MNGYLIAEEGPLTGLTITFEEEREGNEWSLGRDPDSSDVVLEDPMVSRQHALVRLTPEGFVLENLSTVNPATQNGKVIAEPTLLREGDIIQLGSTFFHFTEKEPTGPKPKRIEEPAAPREEYAPREHAPAAMPSELHFGPRPDTRWLLKVISGPNAGAEFAMNHSSTYLIGKDPNICDIVFQDLSVSRQHARITVDEGDNVFIEDLGSRNGVIVNGELISEKQLLASQDLVALGTTTFLVVDRLEARETVISPQVAMPVFPKEKETAVAKEKRDWREMIIPKKHLALAGVLAGILFLGFFALISLLKTQPVVVSHVDESQKLHQTLGRFPGVAYTFNEPSGKLFLTGHVLSVIDHQELLYLLKELHFITGYEDNVIVDELVWQNMNALISRNPAFAGVSLYAPAPGEFVLRGFVDTIEGSVSLREFVNRNFDYLDHLSYQVVVEKNLQTEIGNMLIEKGFAGVTFELSDGEVVFSGRINQKQQQNFDLLVETFKRQAGIRLVKNFVIVTTGETSRIDISTQYAVTGYSKRDEKDYYVVINGKILGQGDLLDGMAITKIMPKTVFLERDNAQFRINYNLQ